MPDEAMLVAFGMVSLLAAIEAIASLAWWSWFYRSTPRLWSVAVTATGDPELAFTEIANHSRWRPFAFKRLSEDEVAFRESVFSLRPALGLVGLIRQTRGVVTITTRWNWSLVGIGVLAAGDAVIVRDMAGLFVIGMVGVLLAMQRHRLSVIRRAMTLSGE